MTANMAALILVAAVSILLPVIVLLIFLIKSKEDRPGILISFISGGAVCLLFEWLIKEQALKLLFTHANLQAFVSRHYIVYIFLVALAGALLAVIPEWAVITYGFKKRMSFIRAAFLGLGFAMAEAVTLVGYQSIKTIIELSKEPDLFLNTTTKELFLSSYERILLMIIHVAVAVILVYFIENSMPVRGCVVAALCIVLESFIPGFVIAFSTKDFLEIYTRDTALLVVYIFLSFFAVGGIIIAKVLKDLLKA